MNGDVKYGRMRVRGLRKFFITQTNDQEIEDKVQYIDKRILGFKKIKVNQRNIAGGVFRLKQDVKHDNRIVSPE